jgi:chorismate--pyruvate lyase
LIPTDLPPLLRSLLLDRGSLTRRLIALSQGDFRVQLDRLAWGAPFADEAHVLGLRAREVALLREVTLLCHEKAAVFARSVMPRRTLQGRYRRLRHLGNRPLGELLFTDKHVARGETRIFPVRAGDALYGGAIRRAVRQCPRFWGRSSLFYIGGEPLLVTEIFLSDQD